MKRWYEFLIAFFLLLFFLVVSSSVLPLGSVVSWRGTGSAGQWVATFVLLILVEIDNQWKILIEIDLQLVFDMKLSSASEHHKHSG